MIDIKILLIATFFKQDATYFNGEGDANCLEANVSSLDLIVSCLAVIVTGLAAIVSVPDAIVFNLDCYCLESMRLFKKQSNLPTNQRCLFLKLLDSFWL